jgi:hypothetical protein
VVGQLPSSSSMEVMAFSQVKGSWRILNKVIWGTDKQKLPSIILGKMLGAVIVFFLCHSSPKCILFSKNAKKKIILISHQLLENNIHLGLR